MEIESTVISNKIKVLYQTKLELKSKKGEIKDELIGLKEVDFQLNDKVEKLKEEEANLRQLRVQHEILRNQNHDKLKRAYRREDYVKSYDIGSQLLDLIELIRNCDNRIIFRDELADVLKTCSMKLVHEFLVGCIDRELNLFEGMSWDFRGNAMNWGYIKFLARCLCGRMYNEEWYIRNVNPEQLFNAPGSRYIENLCTYIKGKRSESRNKSDKRGYLITYLFRKHIKDLYGHYKWEHESGGKTYRWDNTLIKWVEKKW